MDPSGPDSIISIPFPWPIRPFLLLPSPLSLWLPFRWLIRSLLVLPSPLSLFRPITRPLPSLKKWLSFSLLIPSFSPRLPSALLHRFVPPRSSSPRRPLAHRLPVWPSPPLLRPLSRSPTLEEQEWTRATRRASIRNSCEFPCMLLSPLYYVDSACVQSSLLHCRKVLMRQYDNGYGQDFLLSKENVSNILKVFPELEAGSVKQRLYRMKKSCPKLKAFLKDFHNRTLRF